MNQACLRGQGFAVSVAQVLVEFLVELDVGVRVQVEDPVAPVDGVDVVDVLEPPGPELGDEEGLDLIHRRLLEDPAEVDQAVEPLDVGGDLAAQLVVVLLDLHQHLGGIDVAPAVG